MLQRRPFFGFGREDGSSAPRERSEDRLRKALRYREAWFEAFFLQALMLAFSSLLKQEFRARFAEHIKAKLQRCELGKAAPDSDCSFRPKRAAAPAEDPSAGDLDRESAAATPGGSTH